jgi:hypothetical protein
MTQNEIINLAIQAGASPDEKIWLMYSEELETFAELVAAKEREAIIQIIKETPFSNWFQTDVTEAIRARGEQA